MIKKTMWFMTFLFAAVTAKAALVDDFESYTTGSVTSPWVATDGSPTIAQETGGNQYQESTGSYLNLGDNAIAASDTETTVFYRIYKPAANSPDCSIGLSDLSTPTGDWSNFEAYVVVYGNDLRARNGGGNTSLMTISNDTWYNIWLVVNNSNQTYDVYVTAGSSDASTGDRQANNFNFRSGNGDNPADLVSFKIYGRTANGPIRVDDIYITAGTDLTIPTQTVFPPVIVSDPTNVTVNEMQQTSFETVFTSQTTPSVEWYKIASPVNIYLDPAESNIDVQTTYNPTSEQYTSTLTVSDLTMSDSGSYYCRINNESGYSRDSEAADLIVYGLVAHWTLDQDSYVNGDYQEELAGYNAAVNGTPTFVTGVDGAVNGATLISATNGWALCPTFDPVQQSGQMSVSFWANWNETSVTEDDLVAESSNDEQLAAVNGLQADGRWQHICTVFNGTAAKMYVDGILQDETAWQLPAQTDAAINIGIDISQQNSFNGAMDDMRLYNYALDEYEVAELRYGLSSEGSCIPGYADQYDITGPKDLPDCAVDIWDLTTLAENFLQNNISLDLTGPSGLPDGIVDFYEFAELASSWMSCGLYPACD